MSPEPKPRAHTAMRSACYWLQLGRLAAAFVVDPDGASPVDVAPEAPPVPRVPEVPAEPSVLDPEPLDPIADVPDELEPLEPVAAEPTVPPEPLVPELDPRDGEELELEPELFIALFSWTLPCASRQCVAADTFGVSVAAGLPLIEPEPDCADAPNAPHAMSDDASSAVFKKFIKISLRVMPPHPINGGVLRSWNCSLISRMATPARYRALGACSARRGVESGSVSVRII